MWRRGRDPRLTFSGETAPAVRVVRKPIDPPTGKGPTLACAVIGNGGSLARPPSTRQKNPRSFPRSGEAGPHGRCGTPPSCSGDAPARRPKGEREARRLSSHSRATTPLLALKRLRRKCAGGRE